MPELTHHGRSIIVRDAEDSDAGFIYKAWVLGICRSTPFNRYESEDIKRHKAVVVEELVRTGITKLACDPVDPDVLLGFACGHSDELGQDLHFAYVKQGKLKGFRRNGIGTLLVKAVLGSLGGSVNATYRTPYFDKVSSYWSMRFDPYRLSYRMGNVEHKNRILRSLSRSSEHQGGEQSIHHRACDS